MFNQYEPNVKATIAFVKLLNVKVNDSSVNETLNNHPDFPTLLSISDSLHQWEVPNGAGRIQKDQIHLLPVPFLAHVGVADSPLALVTAVSEQAVTYKLNPYRNKVVQEPLELFFSKWNGIYLLAEPHEHSIEKDYYKNKRAQQVRSALWSSLLILFALLPLFFVYRSVTGAEPASWSLIAGTFTQYGILFLGLVLTGLLLWYEIDKANPALQKVCTGLKKGNCEVVLNSKQAKLFSWLSWSEVGFFYFMGGFLTILSASSAIFKAASLLLWLNILAAPYILFSLFYQWRIAKHWCILCLGVQALLFIGLINGFTSGLLSWTVIADLPLISFAVVMYLLPVIAWFSIKPHLLRLVAAKTTKRAYLRLKFNTEIFNTLLSRQKSVEVPADGLGISLGNPNSKNKLLKVCNPYCGPCAQAHPSVEALIEEFKDIHVQIIFACNNGEHDRTAIPAKHLLTINSEKDSNRIKQALDTWYLAKEKNYDDFAQKYPVKNEIHLQDDHLNKMKQWCQDMEIQFTPTFFINGKQLPAGYQVDDLKYFLSE